MASVIHDSIKPTLLGRMFTDATAHLVTGTFTPSPTTSLSTVAAQEATFDGYSGQAVPASSWTVTISGDTATARASTVTFTATSTAATQVITGCYLVDSGTGDLLYSEALASFTMAPSQTYNLTPFVNLT